MTVSNAFSRPDQLSAALREKILATAAELGYAGPDPAARTLARGRHRDRGHPVPRHAPPRPVRRLRAPCFLAVVAEELGRGGLALTLLPNLGTPDVLPVRDVAMDGAIIYSCSPVDEQRRVAAPPASPARARRPAARRPLPERQRRRPRGRLRGGRASRRARAPDGSRLRLDRAGPEASDSDRRPGRLVRPARAPARLARRARRRPASRRCRGTSRSRAERRPTPPPASCSPHRTGRRRCSPSPTPSPRTSCAPPPTSACGSPRTCRSSASTTPRSRAASPRR